MAGGVHRGSKQQLLNGIAAYEAANGALPGLPTAAERDTLVSQIISSLRRIDFVTRLASPVVQISNRRSDPHDAIFDPIKGAALLGKQGQIDEAAWLTFIATQFGKHVEDGWRLASNVFGSFGAGPVWTRAAYLANPAGFDAMLLGNSNYLADPHIAGRYSNHRQYESKQPAHLSRVFASFSDWQEEFGGVRGRLLEVHKTRGQNPEEAFDGLYRSFAPIYGFGRLGTFDYLTMMGKLQLLPISPGSVYLKGATGPLSGAKLLFHGDRDFPISAGVLEPRVDGLDNYLNVGKQVIEDSLCNWQKSPSVYIHFKG